MKVVRGLICWLIGHREKRVPTTNMPAPFINHNRICKRCGEVRLAKTRKPKEQQ